jgi:Mce-associated membrane protein
MSTDATEPVEPAVEAEPVVPAPVRSTPIRLIAVLVVVTALALAGALWTGGRVRAERSDHRADAAALAAGRTAATAFTSYDYRHLDTDLNRVAAMSTGTFRVQFTKALGALTQAIKQAQGVSAGQIGYAGLTRRTGDTAVVLAAVDATITNTASTTPSVRRYRLKITLDDSSGAWLISDISPVT